MAVYKPSAPFNVPLLLLAPTSETVLGVEKKTFPAPQDGVLFYGSFRTFGGTEKDVNGVYSLENTAVIETWYRPEIKANCRIAVAPASVIFEIIGEPENIRMQNQYLRFKVREIKGGA